MEAGWDDDAEGFALGFAGDVDGLFAVGTVKDVGGRLDEVPAGGTGGVCGGVVAVDGAVDAGGTVGGDVVDGATLGACCDADGGVPACPAAVDAAAGPGPEGLGSIVGAKVESDGT